MYNLSIFLSDVLVFIAIVAVIFLIFSFIGIVLSVIQDCKNSKIFKYEITIPRGNSSNTYYTNEYEIKDNVIHFNNMCATHFIVRQLKEEAN